MENQGSQNTKPVPDVLKIFFIFHFVIDLLFAIPLIIIPCDLLYWLGWEMVDPIAARLVAAALLGIGIESLAMRNSSIETYIAMLNLKIIWSSAAVIGILLCVLPAKCEVPFFSYILTAIFAVFDIIWIYWRWVLEKEEPL